MSSSVKIALPQGSRVVYENPYQKIWKVSGQDSGSAKEYFVTDYGPRAGLVLVKGTDLLLVRQYRLLVDRLAWEVPGGKVDDGETPEAAAIRECREETGLEAREICPLLQYQPGLDTLYNPTFLFYTTVFAEAQGDASHGSEIHGHAWLPLNDVLQMIYSGEIVDSFTILAVLAYKMRVASRG